MAHLLDNPIYHALNSAHRVFAKGTETVKHYEEEIASFAGFEVYDEQAFATLYQESPAASTFVVFSPIALTIPEPWKLLTHIDMFQMVYEQPTAPNCEPFTYTDLAPVHVAEMTELVELTKPGPFRTKTITLSNYTGIFKNEKLVAMAGHRFHPEPYIEISAVCTHPDHLGNGYAYQLLSEQIRRILDKNQIPFLHVRNDNESAIKLYQKIGFSIRTEMLAYVIQK